MVLDGRPVKLVTPLGVHLPMSSVQDVRDTQLPQAVAVIGDGPVNSGRC